MAMRLAAAQTLALCGPNAQAAVPALIEALKDSKTIIHRNATVALGKIGPVAIDVVPAAISSQWQSARLIRRRHPISVLFERPAAGLSAWSLCL